MVHPGFARKQERCSRTRPGWLPDFQHAEKMTLSDRLNNCNFQSNCCIQLPRYTWATEFRSDLMIRRLGNELGVLAIVGTVAIFLFPAVAGPYSIVHGPATALRAMRAWLLLLIALTLTLASSLQQLATRYAVVLTFVSTTSRLDPLELSAILRC